MPRRSRPSYDKAHLASLRDLLDNFDRELESGNLRAKVQALIPVHYALRDLGGSLIHDTSSQSGRARILKYLLEYPFISIAGMELMIVSGIGDWPRRVRELRKELGWPVITGQTAKEMAADGEFFLESVDIRTTKSDDYILVDTVQDKEAAYRWKIAKDIRNKKASVRDKILEYLQHNVAKPVTGEELRYVAKDKTEWARRARELRTQLGWPVVTKSNGRPDLPVGVYLLEEDRQSPAHDRNIKDEVRRSVLRRDNYQCCRCKWNHDLWNRSDPRHLELHHVQAHVKGGENDEANLVTLCTVCHDEWHSVENIDFTEWVDNK